MFQMSHHTFNPSFIHSSWFQSLRIGYDDDEARQSIAPPFPIPYSSKSIRLIRLHVVAYRGEADLDKYTFNLAMAKHNKKRIFEEWRGGGGVCSGRSKQAGMNGQRGLWGVVVWGGEGGRGFRWRNCFPAGVSVSNHRSPLHRRWLTYNTNSPLPRAFGAKTP